MAAPSQPPTASEVISEYDDETTSVVKSHIGQIANDTEKQKANVSRDHSSTTSACASVAPDEEQTVVSFVDNDPLNPYNWKRPKKVFVVVASALMVLNSTIGSSIASGGSTETKAYFHLQNEELLVLPISIYLVGYVIGPLVFAPLSESYGRKPIMIATFIVFTAFTLGCALAPTFAGLIVMRLLTGIGASTPISVIGGIYADIYNTRKARGLVVTLFMSATTFGPVLGPVISGFIAPISWRWPYWIALIIAGITWPFLLLMPETYGPIILKKKAQGIRKKTGDLNVFAPTELEKQDLHELVVVVLTRPIRMFLFEAICLTTCLYLSVVYGIFYSMTLVAKVFFQAFPIVYEGTYGFNAGEEGLTFLPIGIGAVFASLIYLWWDAFLERAQAKQPPAKWTQIEEYVRLPLACLGGPLFVIALFWLGWTARPSIHWIVPTLSALPFGIGFLLIFMGELNYLVDAYEVYAASAMGAASCARSIFGVILPFAARPMYTKLGIPWACSLLGFLSLLMAFIPFIFIKYGDLIRANSKFCQEIKQQKGMAETTEMRIHGQWELVQREVEEPDKQV